MSYDPVPQRLSDAERDTAAQMLREHYEAGRLDAGEFEERLSAALSARIAADFQPLFADLPAPHPGSPLQPYAQPATWAPTYANTPAPRPDSAPPGTTGNTDWLAVAKGVIWPAAIVMGIVTGNWATFIIIAIIGSVVLSQISNNQRKPPPYLER